MVQAIELIAYDISTEIEARKELIRADRLAALGALAAGVAHEINNPIAFISLVVGQLRKLTREVERGEPGAAGRLEDVIEEVRESAGRIAAIVGELKLFTRIGEGDVACPVDVNRILQTALALTSSELKKSAELVVELGPLPLASGAFVNLGHAFVNLLMNAGQAVATKHAQGGVSAGDPGVIRVRSALVGETIVVSIEDTGIGIEERVLPRIFDPFFKLSASASGGGGAGLGLAIAYDLVRRVGGDIRVESRRMRGTKFEVVLPLGAEDAAADVPASRPRGAASASGRPREVPENGAAHEAALPRVLVIDDERALVRALARQLSDHYDVDTAATARDALAQLSLHTYDVIVCDVRMPDQSGPQIDAEVGARSAEQAARFVFMTGGATGAATTRCTSAWRRPASRCSRSRSTAPASRPSWRASRRGSGPAARGPAPLLEA